MRCYFPSDGFLNRRVSSVTHTHLEEKPAKCFPSCLLRPWNQISVRVSAMLLQIVSIACHFSNGTDELQGPAAPARTTSGRRPRSCSCCTTLGRAQGRPGTWWDRPPRPVWGTPGGCQVVGRPTVPIVHGSGSVWLCGWGSLVPRFYASSGNCRWHSPFREGGAGRHSAGSSQPFTSLGIPPNHRARVVQPMASLSV